MLAFTALIAVLPLLASAAPLKRADNTQIHVGDKQDYCLTVAGDAVNGAAVSSALCSAAAKNHWDINRGDGLVRLSGTNYCLDAGSNPSNNVAAKIWTCYPGLGNQQWYYTDDNRIAITGGNQCLDNGPSGPQTYQCTTGNTNQVWLTGGDVPPKPSASASASASGSASVSASSSSKPPGPSDYPRGGKQIHPYGDEKLCLMINGYAADGAAVIVNPCASSRGAYDSAGRWDINRGDGQVRLHGTNYCLDAGENQQNGNVGKVWTCYPGLSAQQWYYTDDNHIAVTGGNQCLDVRAESGRTYDKPYGSLKSTQTWQCDGGNKNQIFTVGN